MTLKSVRLGEFDINTGKDCIQELNGDLDCNDLPIDMEIETIIPHPLYDSRNPSKHHDIAILKLKKKVVFTDFIKPICLPSKQFLKGLTPGDEQVVTGWGLTDLCKWHIGILVKRNL